MRVLARCPSSLHPVCALHLTLWCHQVSFGGKGVGLFFYSLFSKESNPHLLPGGKGRGIHRVIFGLLFNQARMDGLMFESHINSIVMMHNREMFFCWINKVKALFVECMYNPNSKKTWDDV